MASKQNIKEAISLLCKIINHHGATKIMPETFRVAKFNKDEATEPMWKLLFETNRFLNRGSFKGAEDLNTEHRRKDIVLYSKHELFKKGYYAKDFFTLPEDMSSGSREILLAFGWLMTRTKLLRTFLQKCNSLIGECLSVSQESIKAFNHVVSEKFGNNSEKLTSSLEISDALSNLSQLSWILGNLKLTYNGLYSAENNLVSLVNKVHCATIGAGNPKEHLSAFEVFILRHPKQLVKFKEKLDCCNSYLENLLKFVELQNVFWKWMESVYEAKLTQGRNSEDKDLKSTMGHHCKTCQQNANQQINMVSEIQLEVQNILDNGNALYFKTCEIIQGIINKPGNCLNEIEWSEFNDQMKTVSLKESSVFCRNKLETFPELRHVPRTGSSTGNIHPVPSCASQGIKLLKGEICQLDVIIMEMRKLHFEILNDLTANLKDLVCIPPIQAHKYYTELQNMSK